MTQDQETQSERTDAELRRMVLGSKPPDIMGDDRVLLAWHRSHMANERTFLAWARTAVSLLAFGFVIEKFEVFLKHLLRLEGGVGVSGSSPHMVYLSLFSFALAGVMIFLSGIRFLRTRRHIDRGEASYSAVPDMLVVASVVAIIIITIFLSMPRLLAMGL